MNLETFGGCIKKVEVKIVNQFTYLGPTLSYEHTCMNKKQLKINQPLILFFYFFSKSQLHVYTDITTDMKVDNNIRKHQYKK